MNEKKDDVKVILSRNIANQLLDAGFQIKSIDIGRKNNALVFVFRDGDAVERHLTTHIFNNDKQVV